MSTRSVSVDRRNLVGSLINLDLAQDEAIVRGPRVDNVGNGLAVVWGAAVGLAIVMLIYRNVKGIEVDKINFMKW